MAAPRYITHRSSRYSYGPRIARVSDALGRPFMPWQHEAAGLIGECDAAGHLLNPVVVVTVPRQSGKTALLTAVGLHRLTMRRQCRAWYTAQTGIKAREQLKEQMDATEASMLRPLFTARRGASDTSLTLDALGSRFTAHPPTGDSLHGNQSDLNVVDEGWFYDEPTAGALMGAITPTQNTRPNPQTIIVSTMGTAASTWFHGLVERGRAGELCLIDYGIADDVDPMDDDAIAAAHPAIGHTIDVGVLASARTQLPIGEYIRAYGNRPTASFLRLFPGDLIAAVTTTGDLPAGPVSFGAAVSFERDECVTVATSLDGTGRPVAEVVDRRTSTTGAADLLATLTSAHGGHVVIDGSGPAASLADDAERAGATVTRIGAAELAAGTVALIDAIRRPHDVAGAAPGILLRSHPAFSDALEAAATRRSGDRLVWSRRGSAASIAALEATTCAVHAIHEIPNPPVAAMIWS